MVVVVAGLLAMVVVTMASGKKLERKRALIDRIISDEVVE